MSAKMRRTVAIVVALLVMCSCVMSAFAVADVAPIGTYNLKEHFLSQSASSEGGLLTDTYRLYRDNPTDYDMQWDRYDGTSGNGGYGSPWVAQFFGLHTGAGYEGGDVDIYICGYNYIDLSAIPNYNSGTYTFNTNYSYWVDKSDVSPTDAYASVQLRLKCYDADKQLIFDAPIASENKTGTVSWTVRAGYTTIASLPAGSVYIVPYLRIHADYSQSLNAIGLRFYSPSTDPKSGWYLTLSHTYSPSGDNPTPDETVPGETTPTTDTELGDKLDGVQDAIDSLPDKEQHAADNQGNSSINGVLDVVPDYSDGFVQALGALAGSMSYSGTSAVLTTPVVAMPAIPGVMSGIQLMPSYDIDFGYWVQQLPSGLLTLVQSLLTLALVGYCFKELYSTIAYLFTLRGGPTSE